jgi:hypothetical protein
MKMGLTKRPLRRLCVLPRHRRDRCWVLRPRAPPSMQMAESRGRSPRVGTPHYSLSPRPSSQPNSSRAVPRPCDGWTPVTPISTVHPLSPSRRIWKPFVRPSRCRPRPRMPHRVKGNALLRVRSSPPRRGATAAAAVPGLGTLTVLQWRPLTRLLGRPRTNGLAHNQSSVRPCTSA